MRTNWMTVAALLWIFLATGAHADQRASRRDDYSLFVAVKVRPGTVASFKKALLSIVEESRAEEGNLGYLVLQSPEDPTQFAVYERWESDAAHERHVHQPFFVEYARTVGPMIEKGYPIRKKYLELE